MTEHIQQAAKVARDEKIKNFAKAISGFRIIENPMLGENEIAIVCGSNIYKVIVTKADDS